MVWYVRLLKPPKLDQNGRVQALITVTTDLGDQFYYADLTLYAFILNAKKEDDWSPGGWTFEWKSGMRQLWIDISNARKHFLGDWRLVVTPEPSESGTNISLNKLPEVLGIWCAPFDWTKVQAPSTVERRIRINGGPETTIVEETGESIARHFWDAGIILVTFVSTVVLQPATTSDLSKLLHKSAPHFPRILELGSGCGIVGIQVADFCPRSDVLLTDLPNAMDILNLNIERDNSLIRSGTLATAVLDWHEPLPEIVAKQRFDLVIVSDCVYNDNSIPGLVKTLLLVAETSPDVLILVSLKVRHVSESIFFDLMATAKFSEIEHTVIQLPDRHRIESGEDLEVVHVHVFHKQDSMEAS